MPVPVDPNLLATFGLTPGRRRGYVLVAPVIAHVLALEQLGWTYERTSLTAGLATCSVRQMLRQNNELIMARRAVAIMQIRLEPFKWKFETHGELSCYHEGCRCEPCRDANKAHMKKWHRSRNARTRLLDAEPIRQQLQDAINAGLTTWTKTHQAIGGSSSTVTKLLAGRYSHMRQPTARRFLAYLEELELANFRQTVDLCLICGWPVSEHRPYYAHLSPYRAVVQPSLELARQTVADGRISFQRRARDTKKAYLAD